MKTEELTRDLKALAKSLGFSAIAITPAAPLPEAQEAIRARIEAGMMAGLAWFTPDRAKRATDPEMLLPNARSVVSLAVPYWHGAPVPRRDDRQPRGRISRYAWGRDYHNVLRKHLRTLVTFLDRATPGSITRPLVDYGPLAERAYGAKAGLGWFGKHTNLLVPGTGSWAFLAELVTTVQLEPDRPLRKTCGACTRCMPVCPTGAITGPYLLDSRRCISYLTIEHRGPIDRELRPLMGDWIFGCDLCQDPCPVNRRAMVRGWSEFRAPALEDAVPALIPLLSLGEEEFRERFRGRAVMRAKRAGFLRNVCIALGNIGDRAAIVPLVNSLGDPEPLVRGHAAWALGRLGGAYARGGLESALRAEDDPWVREEIEQALVESGAGSRREDARQFREEIVSWLASGSAPAGQAGATKTPARAGAAGAARPNPVASAPAVPDETKGPVFTGDEYRQEIERHLAEVEGRRAETVRREEPLPEEREAANRAFRALLMPPEE